MERKFASEETKQPLFSVIMPVYNVEKYVSQAIESVLHQEFIDFELIIVNDCSPDGSLAICKKYAEKDHRITIISLDKNGGLSNARNVGMSAMRGRYVLFLDSDDWWDEDLLQSVADVIEQDEPDIVFLGYRDEWFSMDDRQLQTVPKIPKAISIKNNHLEVLRRSIILQAQDNDMYSWSANKAIKNKKKPSLFIDVPLSEDKEYIGRLWENASSLSVIAKSLLHYRRKKAGSLRSKYQPHFFKIHKLIWDYRYNQLLEAGLLDEGADVLKKQYLQIVYLTVQMMCYPEAHKSVADKIQFIHTAENDKHWDAIRDKSMRGAFQFQVMGFFFSHNIYPAVLFLGEMIYFIKVHSFWLWRHLR